MSTNEIRDGAIGITAGLGGAFMQWFDMAGRLGSNIASIVGAIIAVVMLWRLIFRDGKNQQKQHNEER